MAITRRIPAIAQAATGAVLLARPQLLVTLVSGNGEHPANWIVRVLGARMLGQGCVVAARPSRVLTYGGAAVDVVHATSMVLIARAMPEYRRPAVVSALTAATFAAASAATMAGEHR